MVCKTGQICLIHSDIFVGDKSKDKPGAPDRFILHAITRGKDLYDYIEEHFPVQPETFKLYLLSGGRVIDLSKMKDKTMSEVGVDFSIERESSEGMHTLLVAERLENCKYHRSTNRRRRNMHERIPAPPRQPSVLWGEESANFQNIAKAETSYVGLVNQAMTCYLNSLLQALYMTPEFRNALYNWEYVDGSEKDEANSIPYQLQKLFLNLQTSTKSAVETTSLTKSFGWDSTEAWQQHDIQELCRVMFDALEQKFKNTEHADLINRLYEGKMIDYVKCLECGTEKSREDTFLDIPLPVRPFGSSVAYNSVEEAMRAFVQYETLEGANQYHCEKCNKKCDAHKGLKFTKFPYLLTLHLKRFDFDYKTFHRIKLNDKVTFPDILNLNSFISSPTKQESPGSEEENSSNVKADDSSTTESGTVEDVCPPCENNISKHNHSTNSHQDDDEEVEINNGPSTSNYNSHNHENEKNLDNCSEEKGPYIYELFSIMIHSGSASGGHYYAHIKDFRTQEWLCFNDQLVSQITHDEIQKTYGGGPTRSYYSGAYSSSTNAYMLMYRQIDPARNTLPMQAQDFPPHIQELLKKMKENEDRENRATQLLIRSLKIYCHHPVEGKFIDIKLYLLPHVTWAEATERAYKKFDLEGVVSLNQCRLVSYDYANDLIACSFEGKEEETVGNMCRNHNFIDLLLEIRNKDQKFETYLPGGVATKVYVIDVPREEIIDGPLNVRGLLSQTVREYKRMLGEMVNIHPSQMKMAIRNCPTEAKLIEREDTILQCEDFYNSTNVFISTMIDTDSSKPFHESTLKEIIENLDNVISLQVQLPDISKETLEELNIPSLEEKYKDKEGPITNGPSKSCINNLHREVSLKSNEVSKHGRYNESAPVRNMSPQLAESEEWNTPEQSNSEDSSLSDSDKTLVGDAPEDDGFQLAFVPLSTTTNNQAIDMLNQIGLENWDADDNSVYYFKAMPCTNSPQKILKVLVDKRMKLSTLKKNLEPYVGVPVEYFKVFRNHLDFGELEWGSLAEQITSFLNGERLHIKLGRALHYGEFKVKLYQLLIDSVEPYKFLCEWIVSKDMTIGQAKKEILAEIKRKYDIDIPYEKCRLRQKYYKTASKVYLDDQKFGDIQIYTRTEMILQELPDKEPVTDPNQVVVFVRRWSPEKMELGPFQEIVMDGKVFKEMRKKLSEISDIPEEYIDIAVGKGSFPCNISVLLIQNDLEWNDHKRDGFSFIIGDGSVFLYRDSREVQKSLTPDEVKEILAKETSFLIPLYVGSNYSSRRERVLKIHLDTK